MKQALDSGLTKVICGLPASLSHVNRKTGKRKGEERGKPMACPRDAQKIDRFWSQDSVKISQPQVLKKMAGFPMFTILQKWHSAF